MMKKMKNVVSCLLVFCMMASVLFFQPMPVSAYRETKDVLYEEGQLDTNQEEARNGFSIAEASSVTVMFDEDTVGSYAFDIVRQDTGESVYQGSGLGTGGSAVRLFYLQLETGSYDLVIRQNGDTPLYYSVSIESESLTEIKVTSIKFEDKNIILEVGDGYEITAYINPDRIDDRELKWKSSNSRAVKVNGGELEAVGLGQATITATADGVSAKCNVYVTNRDYEMNNNRTKVFTPFVKAVKNYKKGSWSSSNESVATVDHKGRVSTTGHGKTQIILKSGGKKYITTLYVYDKNTLKEATEKKLRKWLYFPDTLIIRNVRYSGTLKVKIDYIALNLYGYFSRGQVIGYYEKGKFKCYLP